MTRLDLSPQNSQCPSGPNSTTHELTGASLREPGSSSVPAFMAALQDGFQELGPEQLEGLRVEVADIKASLRGRAAVQASSGSVRLTPVIAGPWYFSDSPSLSYPVTLQEESSLAPTAPGKPALLICQAHVASALASTRPSIGKQDWKRYTEL